jgi:hypothetical protein
VIRQSLLSLGTLALAAGFYFLVRGHGVSLALAIGVAALCAPILWVIGSALRPALPDRHCPVCHEDALRLLTPGVREGIRCAACGPEDPELYVPYLIDVDDALS